MLQPNLSCFKCVGDVFQCAKCNFACIKYGKTACGKQRYRCKQCRKTCVEHYSYKAYYSSISHNVTQLLCEGCGIRSTSRLLHISATTVIKRILLVASKIQKPCVPMNRTFEMDEMKTLVANKGRQMWIAYAVSKKAKQVIDFRVGYRSNKTLQGVIDTMLLAEAKKIYTDGLKHYKFLIPELKHRVTDFGTNHIERNNLSLRTCLKRLQRKTICFSKSKQMLEACLRIYFWRAGKV